MMKRTLAFFALLALGACATMGGYSTSGDINGGLAMPGARVAIHLWQSTDHQQAYWPYRSFPFDLFICGAYLKSGTAGGLIAAHRPRAKYIASIGSKDLPFRATTQYAHRVRDAFRDTTLGTYAIYNMTTSKLVSYKGDQDCMWIPTKRSVDSLMAALEDSVLDKPEWDGLYIDEFTATYPAWRSAFLDSIMNTAEELLDWDGDSIPDADLNEIDSLWEANVPYMAEQLRLLTGPSKIIITNSTAQSLPEAAMVQSNGFCVERPGGGGLYPSVDSTRAAFRRHILTSPYPFLGIVFATDTSKTASCYAVMDSLDGVLYGHLRVRTVADSLNPAY